MVSGKKKNSLGECTFNRHLNEFPQTDFHNHKLENSGSPVFKIALSLPRAQVQSLAGVLRSQKQRGAAKKEENNEARIGEKKNLQHI